MTREEAEALIAAFERSTTIGMPELVSLARLGAKVMAPTNDELAALVYRYDDHCCEHPGIEQDSMRYALTALQEPRP